MNGRGSQLAVAPTPSILKDAVALELDPHSIDVSGRIGFFFPDKAAALGHLMANDGQRVPALVSEQPAGAEFPWRLHVGLHRTMGARLQSLPVFALVVNGTPEQLAELESSENIQRREIEPIERAKFVFHTCEAARIRIAREHGNLKQQELATRARWARVKAAETRAEQALHDECSDTSDNLSLVYGWADSAAAALGMGRRDLFRSLRLYRLLIEPFPDLVEALAHHPVVGSNAAQLKLVCEVRGEADRRRVIEALIEDNELSAELARARIGIERPGGPAPSSEQKIVSAVTGNLSRLSATSQKRHIEVIVRALKSDEVKRQLRDRLNEELADV